MAATTQDDDDDVISAINVTPLVDVTLVLLIIFMVTASVIVANAIPVDLPEASTGEETASTVVVYVGRDGEVRLDNRPVDEAELLAALRRARQGSEEVRAIISADRSISHGRFIRVVDAVRQAGIPRFAIDIQERDEADGAGDRVARAP